ncbi:MAG: beta-ketoacyl-[acyl-carrier-protein] synthase II [Acidobacteria bacterium RIFCSPHIGHO2_12_FULL_67_30]|nr:MAG: beta-ketoacyl-[acyl-carrier-protein] synthase II [Acidobacteria bacterium RIFCSPHIGHO2_02_FULL_67_57]OFV84305.1 MAG: beta-ketoacyl-[acyl-carrier-protein] synthase II [Acidobacteria bacterium RIFCSPHIGHO2_01_FULL_67_28]OFV89347.1 MAG: beta-ketoacyl-[acyl-carrier-protein] synthase II [Acidobacteria bacterium RIFCSPHIGHO2_12_FULL_67_30]
MRRVVITGMGVIAAPGASVGDFFSSLVAGRSGSRPIQNLPPEVVSRLNCRIAAEVPGFEPLQHFTEKELDQLDRFSQFALVAARQALAQAGLEKLSEAQQPRTGVCIGTAYGGIETLDTQYFSLYAKNATRLSPLAIPRVMYNAATCQVSMRFQARGPCLTPTTACSSATHALGEAYRMIQQGQADWMLAGGSDAPITYGVVRGWEAMRVLAPENGNAARACRPFSGDRQGIVIGEGAAVFVLEEYEAARRRGAQILAELAGYGANSDASHITQPSVAGPAVAMRLALEDAGMKPEEIDYINAHGTATRVNDVIETRAIKEVFGAHAKKLPVSSTKSMHGHVMGASGAIELVAAVEAICRGVIPPTANYATPDPECDLDYVPNQARKIPVRAALSNSFAFGGLNAVLIVKRV